MRPIALPRLSEARRGQTMPGLVPRLLQLFLPGLLAIVLGGAALLPARADSSGETVRATTEYRVMHRFSGNEDGHVPVGGLARDSEGRIFGTTFYGGDYNPGGTVFMLVPPSLTGRGWVYRVIHRFDHHDWFGRYSMGALTVRDGAVYGTLSSGASEACGCGAIFELRPLNRGRTRWAFAQIHTFEVPHNPPFYGAYPKSGLTIGPDGALYGTTSHAFEVGGTVFRLGGSDGAWTFTTLHRFKDGHPNAQGPHGEIVFSRDGNVIYGTTYGGGTFGQGTVFRLTRQGARWTHQLLHAFEPLGPSRDMPDGALPRGRLTLGSDGALYGITERGDMSGRWNRGTIYRIQFLSGGRWQYTQIHEFHGARGGSLPKSGLTQVATGVFYGTTAQGGEHGVGTVYKLSRDSSGRWRVKVVHSFERGLGGNTPWSAPLRVGDYLFGTATQGGLSPCGRGECGTAYRLKYR